MLLARLLRQVISVGRLGVVDASGIRHTFGGSSGPNVTIRVHDRSLHWKLALRPRLYFCEALMDGTLTIEEGNLYDLIDLLAVNTEALPEGRLGRILNGSPGMLRRMHQYNPVR